MSSGSHGSIPVKFKIDDFVGLSENKIDDFVIQAHKR